MLEVLGLMSKQASRSARVCTNPGHRDAVIKDALSIFGDLATVIKDGKWKGAVPVADVLAMLMDLGFANAKMLTLLGEVDRYAKEAAKSAGATFDVPKNARAAKEKVDELEAKCRDSESSASAPEEKESEDYRVQVHGSARVRGRPEAEAILEACWRGLCRRARQLARRRFGAAAGPREHTIGANGRRGSAFLQGGACARLHGGRRVGTGLHYG